MVRIKEGLLVHASGKMGNKVFRTMNGKTFVSNRPLKYNISHSKSAVSSRAKFAVVIDFSKYINLIPSLKKIWQTPKIKGTTSFNRIVKYNSRFVNEKSPSVNNVILPSENCPSKFLFSFPIQELHFSNEAGMIKLVLHGEARNFEYNKDYFLFLVLMPLEPLLKKDKYYILNHLEISHFITKELPEINIELDNSFLLTLNKYKKLIIYFSAAREVGGRLKYIWSDTFAKEFNISN